MNSFMLFLKRLIREWKFQYGVISSVLDWTIQLYIVIPAIVIGGFIYQSWWKELPELGTDLPYTVFAFFAIVVVWIGNIRTFLQLGDSVFLIKHRQLLVGLKRWAFIFSCLRSMLYIGFLTLLFLPFFVRSFSLNLLEVSAFFIFYTCMKWMIAAMKAIFHTFTNSWSRKIIFAGVFIFSVLLNTFLFSSWVTKPTLMIVGGLLFVCITLFLYLPRLKDISLFDSEVLVDQQERLKYVSLIFSLSYDVEKTKVMTKKKPLLFRGSKRIFKKRNAQTGFLELFIKVLIRNPTYLASYLQLTAMTAFAVSAIPPLWLKIPVFIGFILFLQYWLDTYWEKVIASHPLIKKYEQHPDYFKIKNRTVLFLNVLAIMTVSVFLSIHVQFASDFFN
ncbi:ABC transporter permease [Peribacillus tepidiphilus]|uniref:ABC transporter permease n=1 Tax=Peribacillus tepidiphilus TaxID=2652445 RepID=UPI0035B525A4